MGCSFAGLAKACAESDLQRMHPAKFLASVGLHPAREPAENLICPLLCAAEICWHSPARLTSCVTGLSNRVQAAEFGYRKIATRDRAMNLTDDARRTPSYSLPRS